MTRADIEIKNRKECKTYKMANLVGWIIMYGNNAKQMTKQARAPMLKPKNNRSRSHLLTKHCQMKLALKSRTKYIKPRPQTSHHMALQGQRDGGTQREEMCETY